ncbi:MULTISPECIES: cell wall synthase accessory phosphoprotein MacP [Enterococcus]|uniref:cell wall synthase accessory phosphoprotein MacP n=1 Tax=Enterococcus TaxID=1350 RepID=UPI00065DE763|nr:MULTISPECIES: cell wall synthase accessory phosphoprotein MacP [Enterococcus]KAF1300602.1 hypothetical protein BAU16_12440 [Enterococcus sp. JM9B]
MPKEPLITRTELRKRRELETEETPQPQKTSKQAAKEYKKEEKEISNFYRKENKKNKPVTKTRTGEKQKSREWNNFLMKAIIIVFLLLVVVMLLVFLF